MNHSLLFLTADDWKSLRAHRKELHFDRDATIVREGGEAPGVMVILGGTARVEQSQDGLTITLARLVQGEFFGEMSLLEDTVASASVIADEPTTVELFRRSEIEALLQSDPGFSARFYRSLAVHLSRRLRERSRLFSRLNAQALNRNNRLRTTRLGQITARQLPRGVIAGVEAFNTTMTGVERGSAGGAPPPDAARKVAEACDRLLDQLGRSLSPEALFEAGYADLGSFRDPGVLASGIGGYVFRQTFSWFMSATVIARVCMKPRDFSEDHETLAMIYDNEPDGDGATGPLLDRWFLDRPVCRSRRAGRAWAGELLRQLIGGAKGAALSVAALASGTAAEAIEALRQPGSDLRLTCVDLDQEALAAGALHAENLGVARRIAVVHGNVVPSADEGEASIGRHHFAYALGLLEYLSDDECVRHLDWVWASLLPGGTYATTTLGINNADRALMEHLLEWKVTHRSAPEIAQIFARSRFSSTLVNEVDPSGAGLRIVARRAAR